MNPKMVRLLHEGFSIYTLERMSNEQLNLLHRKVVKEQETSSSGVLNIPKTDLNAIKNAENQKKTFVTYEEEIGESEVTEKAKSKQQQKIMGLALSVKRGDTPKSKVSKSVKDMAKKMSEKDLEDFASTKHKGLPKKVKSKENIKKLEENILRLIEDYLPPHTTKGELLNAIKRRK